MIEVNDLVEAKLTGENESVVVQRFKVTAIDGTSYSGGAMPCDTANGWIVRLMTKDVANLRLPSAVCEIVAFDRSGVARRLIGKDSTWRDETGALFLVEDIFNWVPTELPAAGGVS